MVLELGLDMEVMTCHDKELSSYKINIQCVCVRLGKTVYCGVSDRRLAGHKCL